MWKNELLYYSESGMEIDYHHDGDAGLDLPIWDEKLTNGELGTEGFMYLQPGESVMLKTGVHLAIRDGNFGLLDSRSGTSKKRLDLLCRIIDSTYRGNIRVSFTNLSSEVVKISNGDELFQIVIMPYTKVKTSHRDSFEEFLMDAGETDRGTEGFGSKERNRK